MKQIFKEQIFAHRGFFNNEDVPENSLEAFRLAAERGWGVEFDVHLIRDGSLVVFHDSDLRRCTGAVGMIEELDLRGVKALRLLGTDHTIPTLDEVLEVLEPSHVPLIVEIKAAGGNQKALTRAVCERMDHFSSDYCMESFDPRVLLELVHFRPEVCRGQLVANFIRNPEGLSWPLRLVLTSLVLNRFTKPDFIACKWEDRHTRSFRKAIDEQGIQEVSWTIRSLQDMQDVIEAGSIPIFEHFDPLK